MTSDEKSPKEPSPNEPDPKRYERLTCQIPVRTKDGTQGMVTSWKELPNGYVHVDALFLTREELIQVGAVLEIRFSVPGLIQPIHTESKVIWKGVVKSVMECGLLLPDIRSHDRTLLIRYIRKSKVYTKSKRAKSEEP